MSRRIDLLGIGMDESKANWIEARDVLYAFQKFYYYNSCFTAAVKKMNEGGEAIFTRQ